jgi:hypothetical protein
MSLIPYNPAPFAHPESLVQSLCNLVWYGKTHPTRSDEISLRIRTIHAESQRWLKEAEEQKLLWIATQKDRERATITYTSLLESTRQAFQAANHALIQIHAATEIAHKEKGLIDATQPDEMNTQALKMQACVATIRVAIAPFFLSQSPSPLENFQRLSAELDSAYIKLETLLKKEETYRSGYNFAEALAQNAEQEINRLRQALSHQEASPGTIEMLDDFMNEACAFDIDSDI